MQVKGITLRKSISIDNNSWRKATTNEQQVTIQTSNRKQSTVRLRSLITLLHNEQQSNT